MFRGQVWQINGENLWRGKVSKRLGCGYGGLRAFSPEQRGELLWELRYTFDTDRPKATMVREYILLQDRLYIIRFFSIENKKSNHSD